MKPMVYIYRGDGTLYSEVLSLLSIVSPVLERNIGTSLQGIQAEILVYPIPYDPYIPGYPSITNISGDYGYARVKLFSNNNLIYEHPHSIRELVAEPLQEILRNKDNTEKDWGFYLYLEGFPPPFTKIPPFSHLYFNHADGKPKVEGIVDLATIDSQKKPIFSIKRVKEAPLQKVFLDDFNATFFSGDQTSRVKILVHECVYQELDKTRIFSSKVEEGGFLVGKVYEDADIPETYILELTAAIKAEHTGASLLHFTYTGDSFSAFNTTLRREYKDQRLIGWYHTHLFPATECMGLSSIDLDLHFSTFRQPWQVAGLVNLDAPGQRTLRFYVKQDSLMLPCAQWMLR